MGGVAAHASAASPLSTASTCAKRPSAAAGAGTTDAQSVNVAIAAEQAQTPNVAPSQANLVPTYLATWPSSSFYTITVSGTNTMVALKPNDPGTSTAYTTAGPGTTPEIFNGSSAYTFPTTGATPWPASMAGNGICTGA